MSNARSADGLHQVARKGRAVLHARSAIVTEFDRFSACTFRDNAVGQRDRGSKVFALDALEDKSVCLREVFLKTFGARVVAILPFRLSGESSPRFMGNPFGSMPRARDSGDPGTSQ